MKSYRQVEDILSDVGDFHRRVAIFYKRSAENAEKEWVEAFLEHLKRLQMRLHEGLKQFADEDQPTLGNPWIQYIPQDHRPTLEDIRLPPDMTIDDVVEAAMEVDDRLLRFYRKMARNASEPEAVKEMFGRLAEQVQQEKVRLANSAEQFKKT